MTLSRWFKTTLFTGAVLVGAGFMPEAVGSEVQASAELRSKIERLLAEQELPGLVLQIRHQGQDIYFEAAGKVNADKPAQIQKDSLFRIYSMTKPITAVALLQLVEQGKVKLDMDIRHYLPEFETFEVNGETQIVTVHHLLSHTAGFGYGGGLKNWIDIRYLLANPLSRSNTTDDLIDDLSGIDLKFKPGEKFEYSIASDIQGAIIEAVSGLSLDEYLKRYIFGPLNMKDTHFFVKTGQHHRLVDMYEYDAGTFEAAYVFNKDKLLFVEEGQDSDFLEQPTLISGGGGLVSTAQDYSNFVSMLLNKGRYQGKQLLDEALVAQMLQSHTKGLDTHFMPRVYQDVGFGYGVGVKEKTSSGRNQGTFFWGGLGGTIFWADPMADLQVVAMMQVEDGWVALEKWLIPEVYRLIENQQQTQPK